MPKKISYNVPGIGNLTANLFNYTINLYDFIDQYGHIKRFRRIHQLGRLIDVFQGAHHNRYEYVFLQLSLISELCANKNSDLGLSGKREFCGKMSNDSKYPSTGELLQCLVLLNNMGYLEGTFSTSRAWLTLLKEQKSIYKFFKSGLDPIDRPFLNEVVENYDYYRFHLVIALFQLQRYKRKDNHMVEFATKLLRVYTNPDWSNIQMIQLRKLYDTIRQISFITLDSIYAPVPFNLDLSSILLNFDSLLESLFIKNTTYRIALHNLEQVLQNSVYMSSDSCINTARASEIMLVQIEKHIPVTKGITDIQHILSPKQSFENEIHDVLELDWIRERKIIQEFRLRPQDRDNLPEPLKNEVRWEMEIRKKLGVSRARVGLLVNARKNTVKLAFGITTIDNHQSIRVALKICSEIIKFKSYIPDNSPNLRAIDNDELLLSFLLKSIFGWNKRFILENKNRTSKAVMISNGKTSMIKQLDEYLKSSPDYLNQDEIFEVQKMKDLINNLNYSGLTIAFVGGAKLFIENSNDGSAEFDGIVFFPSINPLTNFGFILEAKNYNKGVTDAKAQLNDRINKHISSELEMTVIELNNRSAFAGIKLKADNTV
ncbi:hypothetical protein RCC89_19805 [Cytophagaceae bacterium ABcell3]|nr:hypothetical protein RCC89_19805 [Cytophagaceae bacterium ABcell3]